MIRFCEGYLLHNSKFDYENFAFQLMNSKVYFVFENGRFHSNICAKNHYILDEHETSSNYSCGQLQYDQNLKRMSTLKSVWNKHHHHNTMSYNHLKQSIDYDTQQYMAYRLRTLNTMRDNVILKNKVIIYDINFSYTIILTFLI